MRKRLLIALLIVLAIPTVAAVAMAATSALMGDTVLDPERPEALVYAPNSDGRL